jgi:hypothetical protein
MARFSLASIILLSVTVTAQAPSRTLTNGFADNDAAGGTMIAIRQDGAITVIESGSSASVVYSFTPNASPPMDFFPLSATDVLIVGNGTIERWSRAGSAYALVDSVDVVMNLCGVTCDSVASKLYLLDANDATVKVAQWTTSQALSAVSVSTWATATQVPALGNAQNYFLRFLSANAVSAAGQVFLVAADSLPHAQVGVLLGSGATPTSTEFLLQPGATLAPLSVAQSAAIDEQVLSEGDTSVLVRGLPGVAFSVVNATTSAVLATAQLGTSGVATVALSSPVSIGNLYAIAPVSGSPSEGLFAIAGRRYGAPESFSNGAAIQRMFVPRNAHVDSPNFQVRVGIALNSTLASDELLLGVMGIGLRGSGDPVLPYGTSYLLQPFILLNAYGFIKADDPTSGYASCGLSIPNDPGLVGVVTFVQFGFVDGFNIRLSEVLGFEIAG